MLKQVTIDPVGEQQGILIVDDDPAILRALSTLLEPYGKIKTASNVSKALAILESNSFGVVVTDYDLGDGNGIDLLESVRSKNPELPVIMITAFGSKNLVIDTLNRHVFGFVEKPFDPQEVEELIQRALKKKQKEDILNKFATLGESAGNLVHEIANPLSIISLKIELLQELASREGNSELMDSANKLSESTRRISEIINWTKGSLKKSLSLTAETFQMRETLNRLRQECLAKAVAQKVQVIITPGSDVLVKGNKDQLLEVFVNLVNNGIEAAASCDEKWVKVDVQNQEKGLQITVTDSGPGIPEVVRRKLFTPLFTTKGEAGTGLGLVIVRKILHAHGGSISLNEQTSNTQFVIQLPSM